MSQLLPGLFILLRIFGLVLVSINHMVKGGRLEITWTILGIRTKHDVFSPWFLSWFLYAPLMMMAVKLHFALSWKLQIMKIDCDPNNLLIYVEFVCLPLPCCMFAARFGKLLWILALIENSLNQPVINGMLICKARLNRAKIVLRVESDLHVRFGFCGEDKWHSSGSRNLNLENRGRSLPQWVAKMLQWKFNFFGFFESK